MRIPRVAHTSRQNIYHMPPGERGTLLPQERLLTAANCSAVGEGEQVGTNKWYSRNRDISTLGGGGGVSWVIEVLRAPRLISSLVTNHDRRRVAAAITKPCIYITRGVPRIFGGEASKRDNACVQMDSTNACDGTYDTSRPTYSSMNSVHRYVSQTLQPYNNCTTTTPPPTPRSRQLTNQMHRFPRLLACGFRFDGQEKHGRRDSNTVQLKATQATLCLD